MEWSQRCWKPNVHAMHNAVLWAESPLHPTNVRCAPKMLLAVRCHPYGIKSVCSWSTPQWLSRQRKHRWWEICFKSSFLIWIKALDLIKQHNCRTSRVSVYPQVFGGHLQDPKDARCPSNHCRQFLCPNNLLSSLLGESPSQPNFRLRKWIERGLQDRAP